LLLPIINVKKKLPQKFNIVSIVSASVALPMALYKYVYDYDYDCKDRDGASKTAKITLLR